jgi:hypothetical protein
MVNQCIGSGQAADEQWIICGPEFSVTEINSFGSHFSCTKIRAESFSFERTEMSMDI